VNHAARVYSDVDELVASVSSYVSAGLAQGDPALVLATRDHLRLFRRALPLPEPGLLTFVDAEAALEAVMDGDRPSPERFTRLVRDLLDRTARPGRRTRVFGELVNLLCERGRPEAAAEIEQLWNELLRARDVSLLCGYRLDVFDRGAQVGTMRDVCRLHSQVSATDDPARFGRAVDGALEEVLGADEAGKVYVLIGEQIRQDRVPAAQLVLMSVSEHLPALAERILATARANYAANAVSSSRA
jgi:hypothetical protein